MQGSVTSPAAAHFVSHQTFSEFFWVLTHPVHLFVLDLQNLSCHMVSCVILFDLFFVVHFCCCVELVLNQSLDQRIEDKFCVDSVVCRIGPNSQNTILSWTTVGLQRCFGVHAHSGLGIRHTKSPCSRSWRRQRGQFSWWWRASVWLRFCQCENPSTLWPLGSGTISWG